MNLLLKCGINNAELPENISIADFVNMTSDLVRYIKEKLPNNKLYLLGMSWGSILSARAALQCEQYIDGVIAYGQVSHEVMQSEELLQAVLLSSAPKKTKDEIKRLLTAGDLGYESIMKISKVTRKYTEGYTNKSEPKAPLGRMIRGMLTSPDYKLGDFLAIMVNGYMKNQSLFLELSAVDLREDLSKIGVPYHIFQGDTDIVTSTAQITAFVDEVKNPYLKCTVVKNAAHIPGENGMKAILDELAEL